MHNSIYDQFQDLYDPYFENYYNNTTSDVDTNYEEIDMLETPLVRITSSIFLFFMILFGVFGNLLVLHIVGIKWKVQTPFNLFLANLAVADILFTIARALNLITHLFVGEFIFGEFACKMIAFFEYFGPLLSILTITVALIALQFKIGLIISTFIVIFLSIIAALPSILQFFIFITFTDHSTEKEDVTHCLKSLPTRDSEKAILELERIFNLKIPLLVLIIYFIIWTIEKTIVNFKILGGFVYDRLLITMALIYIILMTPSLYINNVIYVDISVLTMYTTHFITGLVGFYKPLLYMCMHEGLHREFNKFLHVGTEYQHDRNQFV